LVDQEYKQWRLIKDNIRNTRFEFYEYLSEAGVDIQWMRQEGMITASEISGNSKIKQVKFTRNEYSQVEGSDVKTGWKVWYLVPAVNLSPLRLKLVRKRKFLLFGKVIGMKWRMQMDNGKIHKTSKKELHRYLRHDSALMARLTRCFETIEIVSDMYSLCWNLNDGREVVMEGKSYAPDSNVLQELTPGKEEWDCYQEIASLLLKAPPVSYDMWLDGREWWST